MQPYLPLLHRLIYNTLCSKFISKPDHEVAVVLYGTQGTRHALYDDDQSYPNVTVLRPLQNVASHSLLAPYAFACDPPDPADGGAAAAAGDGAAPAPATATATDEPMADAAVEAAAEAIAAAAASAGFGGSGAEAAAAAARAVRLFGPPAGRADWVDGLVVALDLLARAVQERFDGSGKSIGGGGRLGSLRMLLVSNLLAESTPLDDDFRADVVAKMNDLRLGLDLAWLDCHTPLPEPGAGGAAAGGAEGGGEGAGAPGPRAQGVRAPLPEALAAAQQSNTEQVELLRAQLRPAVSRQLLHPGELLALAPAREAPAITSKRISLHVTPAKWGAAPGEDMGEDVAEPPLVLQVKLTKKVGQVKVDNWKTVLDRPAPRPVPPPDGGDGPDGGGGGGGTYGGGGEGLPSPPGSATKAYVTEREYTDATTGEKFTRDAAVRGYPYGSQVVPLSADEYASYKQEYDKDTMRLLGFVRHDAIKRHWLYTEPYLMFGETVSAEVALAALARAMTEEKQVAVVSFTMVYGRAECKPRLGLLSPHISGSPDLPECLLLSQLPFADDFRPYTFPTLRSEQEARDVAVQLRQAQGDTQGSTQDGGGRGLRYEKLQPTQEEQACASALVASLDLGPLAEAACVRSEALGPEAAPNPYLQRTYAWATHVPIDPAARLPDPADDPLVMLLLRQSGAAELWRPQAAEALRRAEELLQTKERVEVKRGEAPTAADGAGGADAGGDGGADGSGGAAAAGGPAVVFDPSSAGGTAARVAHVGELTAVADFRSMLEQGGEVASRAVSEMCELVPRLVERSIGDQMYDKAIQCAQALREGCAARAEATAFNAFLRDLADRCTRLGLRGFLTRLAAGRVGLLTAADLATARSQQQPGSAGAAAGEGSGAGGEAGVVDAEAARAFLAELEQAGQAGDEEQATLPGVIAADDEFDDMEPIPLIKACRDLGELEALVGAEAGVWSKARNVCALASAYNKAGQLRADTGADSAAQCRVFSTLAAAYLPLVKGLQGGADISIPLHACAKAGYWGGGLAAVLLRRLNSEGWVLLGRSKENELSNLWWSLSEALKSAEGRQVLSSIDLPRLLEASAEGLLAMRVTRTQHCSNVLLACARLRYKNAALMHHLTARLVELGPEAKPQELANSLYALGELAEDVGHAPRPQDLQGLARAVADRLSQDAAAFKPQELSNMLLGCAKLGYTAPSLLHSLVAAADGAAPRMKPQHLANSLYSLALLQPSISAHGGAAEALAEECKRRRFSGFKPQELSNPAWALATMGYADQGWYAAVAEAAGRPGMMQGGTPQNWSNLWYALALVRHQPASGRLLERTAEAAGALRQGAKAQHCANLLWALANLRLYNERLVDALAGRLGELLGQDPKQLTGQGLCNSLWALAVMGPDVLSRHSGLVEGLLREAERRGAANGSNRLVAEDHRQLWYVHLELAHVGGGELQRILGAGTGRLGSLLGAAKAATEIQAGDDARESAMERQVASALERLAERLGPDTLVSVQRGCVVTGLGRAADVVVELAGGRRVAVEVDGPSHFLANRPRDPTAVDGPTELRNRQLGRVFGSGNVLSVPHWWWYNKGSGAQDDLLRQLLDLPDEA
ncbi:hypothetical protein HYH03_004104 [Edaphochlamys debaryana]|uniref:RAP domain-containing protein n=1 Tax=Edaphochlamys debaryana TaxID=47281 RepID=A0A835Y9X0_9CHLO|nr:hypothetical protein HYH03_004104 [Edaphochlamys debaryana]|eukprot:KAG2497834.1 hypothetical protein HYH03_004104 [Edaphochlamys debaryana]